MSITVEEIRRTINHAVLHVRGDAYTPAQLDLAAQMTLAHLVNETRCISRRSTVTLTQGEMEFDFADTDDLDGFLPHFFSRARIGVNDVDLVDVDYVQRRLRASAQTDGTPTHLAFETNTAGLVWPVPDDNHEMTVVWHPGLTLWTPGTMATVTIDIPRRILDQAVWTGAAAALVYGEATGNPWPTTGWKLFLDYVERAKTFAAIEGDLQQPHPYHPKQAPPAAARTPRAGQ